jgi:hypothetical protein
MNIDKDQIQKIISQMEASEQPFYEACKMLKELINPKWEPNEYTRPFYIGGDGGVFDNFYYPTSAIEKTRQYGNEWPTKELAETARDMNKRNQLILQAKTDIECEDGDWIISYRPPNKLWVAIESERAKDNPELTFKEKEKAEEVIRMLDLNNEH